MDLTLWRLSSSYAVAFILSASIRIDSSNSASRLLHARTRAFASNTARHLASAIRNLCLSNLNQSISYTSRDVIIYDRGKETGELLGFVLGFGVKLMLLGGGGLQLGGKVTTEERRPEGWVEGEVDEVAGGDGEAAQVTKPQRGRHDAQLQDARTELVGEI
jgi:hypothetical protein